MEQNDRLDTQIKAALHLQTPQKLSADFSARLRAKAERTVAPFLFKEVLDYSPALLSTSPLKAPHLKVMAAAMLFIVGFSFGTSFSPFMSQTTRSTSLNLYSFYDYNREGLL